MKLARTRTTRTAAGVLAGVLAGGLATATAFPGADAAPTAAKPERVQAYGLAANGSLVSFDVHKPRGAVRLGKVSGLGGESLVGIDVRPADGKLYAVGDGGGLFTVNTRTARATKVATLGVELDGGSFGVDVNPAADALRIVSNRGQNLRHAFAGHVTTEDAVLNVPDVTERVTGIVAVAYTNNDNDDSTGTALFDLNAATETVALQVPANAGAITSQGPLGRKTSWKAGFDIHTELVDGRADVNTGYATLGGAKGYALYRVGMLSGRTVKVGDFRQRVTDIAVVSR